MCNRNVTKTGLASLRTVSWYHVIKFTHNSFRTTSLNEVKALLRIWKRRLSASRGNAGPCTSQRHNNSVRCKAGMYCNRDLYVAMSCHPISTKSLRFLTLNNFWLDLNPSSLHQHGLINRDYLQTVKLFLVDAKRLETSWTIKFKIFCLHYSNRFELHQGTDLKADAQVCCAQLELVKSACTDSSRCSSDRPFFCAVASGQTSAQSDKHLPKR